MTVSRDGKKIIWAESSPKLYMYDVETGKTSEILNEPVIIYVFQVCCLPEMILFFTAYG